MGRMMPVAYSKLVYAQADGIARVTLNRPDKRNALDRELISELKAAFIDAGADEAVRVIVLRGAGKDFCAGMDLGELRNLQELDVMENRADAESLRELFVQMRRLQKPIVAAVHGRALAGGCGLATACDLIVAAHSAQFAYTETRIGFVPAIVSAIVRRAVSEKRAFEMLVRAEPFSATEAERLGLINRVFEDSAFDSQVEEFVSHFRSLSSSAVALTKSLLYATDGMPWEQAMGAAVDVNTIARLTDDCKQGVAQFLKKK
ncbi:MAG: enoyl-CoA hydratase-related protein [Acidobacteriia bacterium]|nr:enoyl-CoA hydratase-related protein [Terriglobia bacterium]